MTAPVCACRRHWFNPDCPVHARPRCSVVHDGDQPEGTWQLPPAIEGDPPQFVCEACGKAMAAQGNPIQKGLWS